MNMMDISVYFKQKEKYNTLIFSSCSGLSLTVKKIEVVLKLHFPVEKKQTWLNFANI